MKTRDAELGHDALHIDETKIRGHDHDTKSSYGRVGEQCREEGGA